VGLGCCHCRKEIWREVQQDKTFLEEIEAALIWYIPDFAKAGTEMMLELKEHGTTFVAALDLDNMEFAPMVDLGFFELTGSHYRMTVPTAVTDAKMRAALLRYTQTEDEQYLLHPDDLIATMTYSDAKTQENRLRALHEFPNQDPPDLPLA
jgi:hypothetical protein